MNKFKNMLKLRILIYSLAMVAFLILLLLNITGRFCLIGNEHFASYIMGMQAGLSLALLVIFIVHLFQTVRALQDKERLKALYYKENDERQKMLCSKMGGIPLLASSIMVLGAGLIAAYINMTVSITLIACGCFLILVRGILKIYYKRKF